MCKPSAFDTPEDSTRTHCDLTKYSLTLSLIRIFSLLLCVHFLFVWNLNFFRNREITKPIQAIPIWTVKRWLNNNFKNNSYCLFYLWVQMKVPAYTKHISGNHRFPIEIGAWNNIDQHLRQHTICDCNIMAC